MADQGDKPALSAADLAAAPAATGDVAISTPPKIAEAVASLEEKLAAEKDGRLEDRFIFLVVIVIFLDIFFLKDAANAVLPIVVLILELIVLLLLAKRLGNEGVSRVLDGLMHGLFKKHSGGE